ncbi:hypothetical protein MMC20_002328 [Loxospora ochrophaea]|nr:hypothetical protein [Loxospora ochrophaea]
MSDNVRLYNLSAEALADLEMPSDASLSPTGSHVVYAVSATSRKEKSINSSVWIAITTVENSARQLTCGLYDDHAPQWCPSKECLQLAFVSDRARRGQSSAIYCMSLTGREPYPLTKVENAKIILLFKWSPNGQFIAFISQDEDSADQRIKQANGDDAHVYGESWDFNRLRCIHVSTREVTTLFAGGAHVNDFAWNKDSTEIAYVLHETPEPMIGHTKGVKIERVSLQSKISSLVRDFPGGIEKLVWSGDNLYFLTGEKPTSLLTSLRIHSLNVWLGTSGTLTRLKWEDNLSCQVDLRQRSEPGQLVELSEHGLETKIMHFTGGQWHLLYQGRHGIDAWDVNFSQLCPTVVYSKGSASAPKELFSIYNGKTHQLTSHGQSIARLGLPQSGEIYGLASDGSYVTGIYHPPHPQIPQPWPTVVLVHGGPYSRVSSSFTHHLFYAAPYFAAAGYLVLLPNYRGSSGRGEAFAGALRGRVGKDDYGDIIAFVREGIKEKLVDETRVAIAGWSQGGFLSYLATYRNEFHFRAAICGAGITDWDMINLTSSTPAFGVEMVGKGKAPWTAALDDTTARKASAVWNIKDVKTPVLLLHGEEDTQIPVSQATAFYRACENDGHVCELVTYPREGHFGWERGHFIDVLKRMRRFVDWYLRQR